MFIQTMPPAFALSNLVAARDQGRHHRTASCACLMNHYWYMNYKAGQGGEHVFRFSITSRTRGANAAVARFGWVASNPLLAVVKEGKAASSLPEKAGSLVEVAEPNVVLIGAKNFEDRGGLILRLWETSDKATTAHVRLRHLPASRATAGNLVEERQGSLEFKNGTITAPLRGAGLASVIIA